jgi:hypothetical protein
MGGQRAYHFRVRGQDGASVKRFRVAGPAADIWQIPLQRVSSRGGLVWIYGLDPRGVVYRIGGQACERFSLPPLPQGFAYSELFVVPAGVIVAWEESDFTDVGQAGLLFADSPVFTDVE